MSARQPALPPLAAAVSFIDCINRRDTAGLLSLMTEDHALVIFEEPPVSGAKRLQEAWQGYFDAFPHYVIYPIRLGQRDNLAAVLGYTTGSHLGLPDEEESRLLLIWTAEVEDGRLRTWTLLEDTPETRDRLALN